MFQFFISQKHASPRQLRLWSHIHWTCQKIFEACVISFMLQPRDGSKKRSDVSAPPRHPRGLVSCVPPPPSPSSPPSPSFLRDSCSCERGGGTCVASLLGNQLRCRCLRQGEPPAFTRTSCISAKESGDGQSDVAAACRSFNGCSHRKFMNSIKFQQHRRNASTSCYSISITSMGRMDGRVEIRSRGR
jgi:hypothetical protein